MTTRNVVDLSDQLGKRIRAIRTERGLNQKDFGALGGVGITTQQQYEAGRTAPTTEYFFRLAEHGVEIPLFERQDAPILGGAITDQIRRAMTKAHGETDSVAIGEIDLAYGLGAAFSDGPVGELIHQFPRTWVERITKTPGEMLTIARGRGDSMQPTIQDGDMVLIDRSQRTIREQDAIWALTIGDFAMIKRVRSRGERIAILSDNERVPPEEVFHEEINIVGRVIFIGRNV